MNSAADEPGLFDIPGAAPFVLGPYWRTASAPERAEFTRLLPGENVNLTRLALSLSGYINGVARRHSETTQQLFPGYQIRSVTNGIQVPSWAHPAFAALYQTHFPHWGFEPEVLVRADQIRDEAIWNAHQTAKAELLGAMKEAGGPPMDPEIPLLGFARRMTAYKRPELLFSNIDRLLAIRRDYPFQIVLAGKAHPRDFFAPALPAG